RMSNEHQRTHHRPLREPRVENGPLVDEASIARVERIERGEQLLLERKVILAIEPELVLGSAGIEGEPSRTEHERAVADVVPPRLALPLGRIACAAFGD